jgi:diadenosine tetraphosphate (Ap4A) HIT family hydrolase
VDLNGCIACDLTHGRLDLPGGPIWESDHWRVEHCVGPLGVGTLLVKPVRHVQRVADLTAAEANEMGPVLHRASQVVGILTNASQLYVCLWSHGPAHIHFVVQPETEADVEAFGTWGPALQAAMFERDDSPDRDAVERFTSLARGTFGQL